MIQQLEELARIVQVKTELVYFQKKSELDITLKVVDQEGRVVKHRMRETDRLQAVMDRYYAEAPEVGYGTGTFLVDGTIRLRGVKTPAELRLENDAQIDFFPYSDGGARESHDDA